MYLFAFRYVKIFTKVLLGNSLGIVLTMLDHDNIFDISIKSDISFLQLKHEKHYIAVF